MPDNPIRLILILGFTCAEIVNIRRSNAEIRASQPPVPTLDLVSSFNPRNLAGVILTKRYAGSGPGSRCGRFDSEGIGEVRGHQPDESFGGR